MKSFISLITILNILPATAGPVFIGNGSSSASSTEPSE